VTNTIIQTTQAPTELGWTSEARRLIGRGWCVLPIQTRKKGPALIEWKGFQQRHPTDDELESWLNRFPEANLAIVTGKISGIVVLDLDSPEAVSVAHKLGLPQGPTVRTCRGEHRYFRAPLAQRTKIRFLEGMDLKADGGYVLAPPSVHPTGAAYEWLVGPEAPLPDLPDWLLRDEDETKPSAEQRAAPRNPAAYYRAALDQEEHAVTNAVHGERNNQLNLSALKLFRQVAAGAGSRLEVRSTLAAAATAAGLDQAEIARTLDSAEKAGLAQPLWPTEKAAGLIAVTVGDLLSRELPEREMILAPWLPAQGLAMLFAGRGIGKTHLALSIAWTVATGADFLGWKAPKARKVLYVDGEMPATVMQERLRAVATPDHAAGLANMQLVTPDLQPEGMPDLAKAAGHSAIEPLLNGVDLVVLDNLSSLLRSGEENEASDWAAMQGWLLDLRRRGVSVLIVHHAGKAGKQRGTSKREDVLDTVVALRRPDDYRASEGARFTVHFEKARGIFGPEAEPFEAALSTEGGQVSWSRHALADPDASRISLLIEDGKSIRDIARTLGRSKSTVGRIAKKHQSQA
jgi:hypothetical protein